jgi:heme/copper-type cytochrome/quinol oxidase subunit 2
MSRGQRFTYLAIALAIAVVAVVVLADSSEDKTGGEPAATTAPSTPEPTGTTAPQEASPRETPTPTETREPAPLLTTAKVTELEVTEGETVRFRVRSDTADHVHVHGYDLLQDVTPGKTVTMSFKATITGIFEIELEAAGKEIARLKVEPR